MKQKLCECGCGGRIEYQEHHKYRAVRFLPGHYVRTAEARAKHSEAIKRTPPEGWEPPSGLCECGCGGLTPIARSTRPAFDQWCGYPLRYLRGHNMRGRRGPDHPQWDGGSFVTAKGYVFLWKPEHPDANGHGYVAEHRLVWEETNGRRLEPDEVVHHINGVKTDNRSENLVALKKSVHDRVTAHENRRTQSTKVKTKFADPDWKAKWLAARKRAITPEYRKQQSDGAKRSWAKRRKSRQKPLPF